MSQKLVVQQDWVLWLGLTMLRLVQRAPVSRCWVVHLLSAVEVERQMGQQQEAPSREPP